MAMADALALPDNELPSLGGGVIPAGDAIELGTMKSSKFIASGVSFV